MSQAVSRLRSESLLGRHSYYSHADVSAQAAKVRRAAEAPCGLEKSNPAPASAKARAISSVIDDGAETDSALRSR